MHRLGGARVYLGPNQNFALRNICEGDSLVFSNLALNPLTADFLEVKLRVLDQAAAPIKLSVSTNDKTASYYQSNQLSNNLARVPLSRDWQWYGQNSIDSIFLLLPPGREVEIESCRLVKASEVAPTISFVQGQDSGEGVRLVPKALKSIETIVTLPPLDNIDHLEIEISKANTFFENFPEKEGEAAILSRLEFPGSSKSKQIVLENPAKTTLYVARNSLTSDSFHQLRVRLLNKAGATVGELSNPVTVKIQ
jgi:hypothetical protein